MEQSVSSGLNGLVSELRAVGSIIGKFDRADILAGLL